MKKTKRKVKCTQAASIFYKLDNEYDVYVDDNKKEYVRGEDGYFDPISKALSKFVKVEAND